MELQVTVQVQGSDRLAGTLFTNFQRGVETASFAYAESYLRAADAFPLAPDMPLSPATIHTRGMFAVFSDAMPDRWGRNLMIRAEARRAARAGVTPRTLLEADYLAGVGDIARQGALRFWTGRQPVASTQSGVPRLVHIPQLLRESYAFEEGPGANANDVALEAEQAVHDLLSAGSSLGGARPKASVLDETGMLMVAKSPKKSEGLDEDTCAWEYVALALAGMAGIRVPRTRLIRVDGKAVLLLERFDRKRPCANAGAATGGDAMSSGSEDAAFGECGALQRIPYLSALTAIQGTDRGSYSYFELADFIETYGSRPSEDLPELWQRILFSCLVGNTDDHMRNHGFLWDGSGWRLSPAFDINPTPGCGCKYLSNAIDFDDPSATAENALRNARYFRVSNEEAVSRLAAMRAAVGKWERVARAQGISVGSIERMRTCFESAVQ